MNTTTLSFGIRYRYRFCIAHCYCNNCQYLTDFSADIFGRNNYFYILSKDVANSVDAQNSCTSAGGKLAELDDGTVQKELIDYAVEKHIPTGSLMKLKKIIG